MLFKRVLPKTRSWRQNCPILTTWKSRRSRMERRMPKSMCEVPPSSLSQKGRTERTSKTCMGVNAKRRRRTKPEDCVGAGALGSVGSTTACSMSHSLLRTLWRHHGEQTSLPRKSTEKITLMTPFDVKHRLSPIAMPHTSRSIDMTKMKTAEAMTAAKRIAPVTTPTMQFIFPSSTKVTRYAGCKSTTSIPSFSMAKRMSSQLM
mmetsp:Transcript_87722/g.272649  ORF Transcript_87722/g.272649 Transcript_87722/m.272649 type:complete len:204 (-) Transcript_87722:390-1001(-)